MNLLNDPKLVWYLMRATGEVSLALMTLSTALGVASTARATSRVWPRFATQALHRNASLLAVCLLAGHLTTAVIHTFVNIRWFDVFVPFLAVYQPLWLSLGALAVDMLLIVVATSLVRHRFGHRSWRSLHLLTYVAWLFAVVHGIGIGTDSRSHAWAIAVTAACVGVVAAAGVVRLATLRGEKVREQKLVGAR